MLKLSFQFISGILIVVFLVNEGHKHAILLLETFLNGS